jgi:glycosyltransferase involved in cell wall biosynthesis
LLELDRLELAAPVIVDMGIELVHSHHAWVDVSLATLLLVNHRDIKQIATMHGMYEMMPPEQLQVLLPLLESRIDRFVYTAEKNLAAFSPEFRKAKSFLKIDNALPATPITPVPRVELHVGADNFLLCLVARAIPEKGWEEAINAVAWASVRSCRKIHLLLIGEGPEFDRLKSQTSYEFVHFLGFRPNIRDYFATSDIGFLPSRFKGESAPLVVIDCLLSGKPVLASDIGEIRYMLGSDDGLAGELIELKEWEIPIETVGQIIVTLANDPIAYQRLSGCVPSAAAKFDTDAMVDKYEEVYGELFAAPERDATDSNSTMRSIKIHS